MNFKMQLNILQNVFATVAPN